VNIVQYVKDFHPGKEPVNWAPYATQMLNSGMDVDFPEGVFVLGDNTPIAADSLYAEFPSNRRSIVWGWGAPRTVRITGAGSGKTILKVADKLIHGLDPAHQSHRMLLSRGEGEEDRFDVPAIVSGITFDGNHRANGIYTVTAMRIIGTGIEVRNCEFVDFAPGGFRNAVGVAQHTPECFVIAAGLPSTAAALSRGPKVIDCEFRSPGEKTISPGQYTTENTSIAIGGNMVRSIMATGVEVRGCGFSGKFDRIRQQAPLHGVTISSCTGARIVGNRFKDFDGFCIYTDSGQQFDTVIEDNVADNVWGFIQYTCQNWVRYGASTWQIPRFDNIVIKNNTVTLSGEPTTYAWDAPDGRSTFMGYLYDRDLNPAVHPGFVDVIVRDNTVRIPEGSTFISNYGGFQGGGWKSSSVVGDVPGIRESDNQITRGKENPTVKEEVQVVQQTLEPGKGSGVPISLILLGAALMRFL